MNTETPGPIPTKRVFLSDIPALAVGSKIRFLGCVSKYDVGKGVLKLEHRYPVSGGPTPSVNVDVNILLEVLKHDDLQIGAWINVLGYVRELSSGHRQREMDVGAKDIYIEAVVILPAGSIRVDEYERVVSDAQEADRRIKRPS